MKTLTLNEVQTINELIDKHEYMDSYSVAYVTELSAFVIAVPAWQCQGNFMGESAVTAGATKVELVSLGASGDTTDFSFYKVEEDVVKLLVVFGGTFEIFGSSYEFNFANKTVTSKYLEDGECSDAYKTIQNSSNPHVKASRILDMPSEFNLKQQGLSEEEISYIMKVANQLISAKTIDISLDHHGDQG